MSQQPTTTSRSEQLPLIPRPAYAWRVYAGGRRTGLILFSQEDPAGDAHVIARLQSDGIELTPVYPGDLLAELVAA